MNRRGALLLLAVAAGWACGESESGPERGIPASLEVVATEPSVLTTVASEPVQGRTGPGGVPFEVALRTTGGASHLHRRIGARMFDLPLRTTGLTLEQYPCSSCHQGQRVTSPRDADVHHDIQPVHPAGTAAACATCHLESAVDRLALGGGESVTLDHAYRLCAQCHFAQVDAWAAGSHGKRLDGWRGRRVVMGCADCHDPHKPATVARIPFPGPRIPGDALLSESSGSLEQVSPQDFQLPPPGARR